MTKKHVNLVKLRIVKRVINLAYVSSALKDILLKKLLEIFVRNAHQTAWIVPKKMENVSNAKRITLCLKI